MCGSRKYTYPPLPPSPWMDNENSKGVGGGVNSQKFPGDLGGVHLKNSPEGKEIHEKIAKLTRIFSPHCGKIIIIQDKSSATDGRSGDFPLFDRYFSKLDFAGQSTGAGYLDFWFQFLCQYKKQRKCKNLQSIKYLNH